MMGKAKMRFVYTQVYTKMIKLAIMIRQIQPAIPQLRKADNGKGRQNYYTMYYFTPQ